MSSITTTSSQGLYEVAASQEFDLAGVPVLVVGAGIMGIGIAQVAAQAGHHVYLYDTRSGAAESAVSKLRDTLKALEAKGKLGGKSALDIGARITPAQSATEACDAGLVIEAIVEKLEAKRALFQSLEEVVSDTCVMATNTSSISVTAIGNGLKFPNRLVGMHFFNPVPLMKLVEVVSGLQTSHNVAAAIYRLSSAWGKTPVNAKSTPGFIVNRIARPFYAEALALLQEQACEPSEIDACLRGAGFRMGPCELMDLIGHDTNFSVTQSVYEANFYDKRYVPSTVQRELVDGGLLGKKSGRGFYAYDNGALVQSNPSSTKSTDTALIGTPRRVVLNGDGPIAAAWASRLDDSGIHYSRNTRDTWTGLLVDDLQIRITDGRTTTEMTDQAQTVVVDLPLSTQAGQALAFTSAPSTSEAAVGLAKAWLSVLGHQPIRVKDTPGLLVARTVCMLINEASDAVNQGVCTVNDADAAMKLGVNYPAGPFEWLDRFGARSVVEILENLDRVYRGERYRVSPWLRTHQAVSSIDFQGASS